VTQIVASELPPGSHLVRFHPTPETPYDRMIVVTEEDEGETLFLQGWIGKPLTPAEWRAAKAERFPKATRVRFERRTGGRTRRVFLKINPA
jgi:hypothetical protein